MSYIGSNNVGFFLPYIFFKMSPSDEYFRSAHGGFFEAFSNDER